MQYLNVIHCYNMTTLL